MILSLPRRSRLTLMGICLFLFSITPVFADSANPPHDVVQQDIAPQAVSTYACPTSSGNSYQSGGMYQRDNDNPVRPAWNHGDKNLALRDYTPTNAAYAFTEYGTESPQPPQLATLFSPNRVPLFTNVYNANNWNWQNPPQPGTRGTPISAAWPVTVLGLHTTPGEQLHSPTHAFNLGSPWGTGGAAVIFADADSVTLKFTRDDSSSTGYTLHIDNICTDPNLLAAYNSLDNSARNTYYGTPDNTVDYNLTGLTQGQVFGTARDTEMRVAIVDTGAFMDPRSHGEWWQICGGAAGGSVSLNLNVNPFGARGILVNPEPGCNGGKYTSGTNVQLTAVPRAGFIFKNWTGDLSATQNPATITMNGDKTVNANFTRLYSGAYFDGDNVSDPALYYGNGVWAWLTSGNNFALSITNTSNQPPSYPAFDTGGGATPLVGNDFNGDGKTDPTVFYPDWGQIYWHLSSSNGQGQFGYFTSTAHPIAISANDYDGDGKSDPALFYPTNGIWSWRNSSNNSDGTAAFGAAGNPTPIPNADMNGDGKSDPALYYFDNGIFAWNANGSVGTAAFSPVGNPLPFLADFDGDGKSDPALYYRTYALWAWKRSSDGQMNTAAFNPNGNPQPVLGFFDNDNKADAGLYYSDFGLWAWKRSTDGNIGTAAYNPGGSPEPQIGYDFDGDGKSDPALYYRTWGLWAWKESSNGTDKTAAYNPGGNPVAIGGLDFDGDGKSDPALYARDWGLWVWTRSSDNAVITKNMNPGGSPQPVR